MKCITRTKLQETEMGYKQLQILVIGQNEKTYHQIRDLFLSVKNISFVIDWQNSIQDGLNSIQTKQYEVCIFVDMAIDDGMMQKLYTLNPSNKILQVFVLQSLEGEEIDVFIFNSDALEKPLECQFDMRALTGAIPFIIRSICVNKELELKIDELQKSKNNLLKMANTNLDGLLILDSDGYVLFGNPAAGQLYSCNPNDLIGKHLGIPLTSNKIVELEILRQDGITCIVEARFSDIEWTDKKAFLVSLRDITEQEHLLATLRKASIYDELTGLFNRREMNRLLEDEISRCTRYNYSSSVVMFDIDRFKAINDSYGHAAGDFALKWISQIINREIRAVDKAARYGGDEFIVLLPSSGSRSAGIPSQRICSAVARRPCIINVDDNKQISLHLTISLGLAEIPQNGDSLGLILKSVDKALYAAKDEGGNCVVQFQDM